MWYKATKSKTSDKYNNSNWKYPPKKGINKMIIILTEGKEASWTKGWSLTKDPNRTKEAVTPIVIPTITNKSNFKPTRIHTNRSTTIQTKHTSRNLIKTGTKAYPCSTQITQTDTWRVTDFSMISTRR